MRNKNYYYRKKRFTDNPLFTVIDQEEPEPETMKQYIKDIIAYAVFVGSVLVLAYAITEAIFT